MESIDKPGWYVDADPDGNWAVLFPSLTQGWIETSAGRVELDPGEQGVLFLRLWRSPSGPLHLVGQSQTGRGNLHYDGVNWSSIGGSYGVNPVAFWPDGRIEQNIPAYGSQGIRWIDDVVHTGDATYADGMLSQFTDLGDIRIGQGQEDGVVIHYNGQYHVLSPGYSVNVRASRKGSRIAVAWVRIGSCSVRWFDVSEIAGLPLLTQPVPPPAPPPKEIPPVPQPTPNYTDNPTDALKALRSHYPTPLGEAHAQFLIAACKAVGHGAGLLAKSGGSVITLPTGQTVSQDWMVFPDGFGTDFLTDGEGAARVGWGQLQEYDKTRYVDISGIIIGEPGPKPIPEPKPLPGPPQPALGPILAQLEVLSRDIADLASRIAQLEAKPDPTYEVRIGRSYGHSHSASIKKVG